MSVTQTSISNSVTVTFSKKFENIQCGSCDKFHTVLTPEEEDIEFLPPSDDDDTGDTQLTDSSKV